VNDKIFPEWDDYIKKMLTHVKFRFDRAGIREEYEEHMEDLYEMLIDSGMDEEQARREVLNQLGDADANGEGLNMAHHPVIGWVWWIARTLMIVVLVIVVGSRGYGTYEAVKKIGQYERIYDGRHIMAEYEINQFITVDEMTLYFDNVVRFQSTVNPDFQCVNINYIAIPHIFSKTPITGGSFWEQSVTDENGVSFGENINSYSYKYRIFRNGVGHGSTAYGFITTDILRFPVDSNTIIIDYNKNGRQFYLEIPVTPVSDLRNEEVTVQ